MCTWSWPSLMTFWLFLSRSCDHEMPMLWNGWTDPRYPWYALHLQRWNHHHSNGNGRLLPCLWRGDFEPRARRHYSELLEQFQRQVAAYVDPDYIAIVRKKLDLDQRQAAEIFGGGVNAFSRYENGKIKPPLALVKLLKVLERHPDLLDEIRTIWFRLYILRALQNQLIIHW